jgi:hypothetical protein
MITLTISNFDTEMLYLPSKLNLGHKAFSLLLEAYRRKHLLNSHTDFLGLGAPSYYKSDLFQCSGNETPRASNWYKLTKKGEEKMALLETLIKVEPVNKLDINNKIFLYN